MSNTDAGNGQTQALPQLNVLVQYIKDLSFENPNAPGILAQPPTQQPRLDINVNVAARQMGTTDFEVELNMEAKAGEGKDLLFQVELVYAGVFRILNVPPEALQPLVMIECPRILFPFARQILADATRNGGYPPLMVDPIDFVSLFQSRQQQMADQAAGGTA
jgi:preprotein translocase subunit SecB